MMKKVLFLAKIPTKYKENLLTKIYGEINAHKRIGFEVWHIEWDGDKIELVCDNNGNRFFLKRTFCIKKKLYYHTLYFIHLYRMAYKVVRLYEFDVVYMRLMPLFKEVVKLSKLIKKKGIDFLIEIPSSPDTTEANNSTSLRRKICLCLEKLYSSRVWKNVTMFLVCSENRYDSIYGRPAINIYNGVDLSLLREKEILDNDKVHILALASMSYWQGFDRLIRSLAQYPNKEDIILHFVGNDGDGSLKEWIDLAGELGVASQLIVHGALYGKQLDSVCNEADIGIGPLGLYRKNKGGSASLKVREYMARGLPYVYAGEDIAIEYNSCYMFRVTNDNEIFDMNDIVEFAKSVKGNHNICDEMRAYAEENLTWEYQMEMVYHMLDDIKKNHAED